ncbi:MAG: recombinase family protein [Methylococcaceae bacterium]
MTLEAQKRKIITKAIGYVRVSSKMQSDKGFGLEAQKDDIVKFCEQNNIELLEIVEEVQSAKDDLASRPILKETLKRCKNKKAPAALVVAKLDRLSRNVHAISGLMEQNVEFVVTRFGLDTDNFMLHIYAAMAEKEREYIKQRTKDAIAVKVRSGGTVGSVERMNDENRAKAKQVLKEQADNRNSRFVEVIKDYAKENTNYEIAKKLTTMGLKTPTGKDEWQANQVKRIIDRFGLR